MKYRGKDVCKEHANKIWDMIDSGHRVKVYETLGIKDTIPSKITKFVSPVDTYVTPSATNASLPSLSTTKCSGKATKSTVKSSKDRKHKVNKPQQTAFDVINLDDINV